MAKMVLFKELYDAVSFLEVTRRTRPPQRGTTSWISGLEAPVRIGWYDRNYADAMCRTYWNGSQWMTSDAIDAFPHWRQVGDYPAWRGQLSPDEISSWKYTGHK